MEDIDYGALFGIDEGGNEQEAAAPAEGTEEAQGANEQEVAEPAETKETTKETDGAAESGGAEDDMGEGTESPEAAAQSSDDNARFAAARRKAEAERDAAIEKAKQDAAAQAQRVIDEAFRNSGMVNPYTKKPITSKAEYDEYKKQFDAEQKAGMMKKSGMSEEEFNQFVANLPEVRVANQAKEAAESAAKQAREQQAKLKVDEQLKEINALDPSIKELKDLSKMETYPVFYELVKKGNTLTDAFKLANYEALTRNAAAASRQAAINAAQSKQHLSQTAARGAGAVSVPADVKEAYRAFNPNATDAEIQQHYNKYVKK